MNTIRKKGYSHITLKNLKKTNKFYVPHVVAINNLHNIYLVTEISRNAIHSHREGMKEAAEKFIPLEVPDTSGALIQSVKKKSRATKILKNAYRHEIYSNSLIAAVSATESYLEKTVEICLLKDPRRLSHTVKKQAKKGKLSEPEIEVKIDDTTITLRSLLDASYGRIIRKCHTR